MIEINLLPGAAGKRKARSGGGQGPDVRAMLAGLGSKVRDPYMIAAAASIVLAALIVGGLFLTQQRRDERLAEAEQVAVADSARFASFLRQRVAAQATRDTVLRQINVIRAIDGDRYLWPHVLHEVSAALPQYTWLTRLAYTGTAQGSRTPSIIGEESAAPGAPAAAATPAAGRPGATAAASRGLDTDIVRDSVTINLEGQTVDIEAITRFMRQLEASPFISDVQLGKSQLSIVAGREVTTFSLQASYVHVDSGSVIRRVPLAASVATAAGN
ncbi:MAG: PilN domain-containing protein [Gemmatimonadaceae bacterium]|nr:PilN domain-containing protein [Gemmatimonadaceae bacterium]